MHLLDMLTLTMLSLDIYILTSGTWHDTT